MVTEFEFPDVGEGVTEGTLIKWLVEEGDEVEEDESLAEVETDKAVVEIPASEEATILELHAEEGDLIHVGDVIVTLGEEGEEPSDEDETSSETEAAEEDTDAEEPASDSGGSTSIVGDLEDADQQPAQQSGGTEHVLAAPSTRRLAREKDVDIAAVEGSGPGGRVTKDDVLTAAEDSTGQDAGAGEQVQVEEPQEKVLATPATRRLAKENDVDIHTINGSGPEGRVTKEDVRRAAEQGVEQEQRDDFAPASVKQEEASTEEESAASSTSAGVSGGLGTPNRFEPKEYDFEKWGETERVEMSGTRKAIAKNMERSKYTAPHVTSTDDADVTDLWAVREKEKEVAAERDVHLTFLPFIVKAAITAMREYPLMNASFDEETGEVVKKKYFNIGIAVATEDGLMVPNIKDADQKSILQIAKEMNQLADKARAHKLSMQEMQGGTFTITNYGAIGGRYGTPILNYPEVGILGTGTISDEAVVRDGEVVVRKMLPLSVSFDHRVIDGGYVAQFMNELIKHLEDPDLLLLDE